MHLIEIPLEWEALGRDGLVGAYRYPCLDLIQRCQAVSTNYSYPEVTNRWTGLLVANWNL